MTEQQEATISQQSEHAAHQEAAGAASNQVQMDQATAINSSTPPPNPVDDVDARIFGEGTKEAAEVPAETAEPPKQKYAGKYDSIDELENGYINLQKKIGSFAGSPDEYSFENINTEDAALKFNPEDRGIQNFINLAKENNVSQEFFEKCLNIFRESVQIQVDEANKDYKSLGAEADKRLAELNAFAKNNLSQDGYARYKKFANSPIKEADLLLLLDDFRNASKPVEGPTSFANPSSPAPTDAIRQLKMEIHNNPEKYMDSNDSRFRDRIHRELDEAYARLGLQQG